MRRLLAAILAAILATCVAACVPVDDEVASIDGAGVTTTRHHLTVDGRRVLVQLHRPPGAAADVPTVIFLPPLSVMVEPYRPFQVGPASSSPSAEWQPAQLSSFATSSPSRPCAESFTGGASSPHAAATVESPSGMTRDETIRRRDFERIA